MIESSGTNAAMQHITSPVKPKKRSIVIPVYNEEHAAQELIRLVVAAILPAHLELIGLIGILIP